MTSMLTSLIQHFGATACTDASRGFCTNLPKGVANGTTLQHVLQIVFSTLAAIAILIIVIAAFNYVISSGEPQKTAKSRETIIYALVGLVVAILSDAIVTFVLGNFT